jgi:protease-4
VGFGSAGEKGQGNDEQAWRLLERVALASTAEQRKARRWGIFFKSLTFIYLFLFLWLIQPDDDMASVVNASKSHVAVIDVFGVIAAEQEANAGAINTALRKAFKDDHTQAIILNINSPGGSPVQSGYVYDEIKRLRAQYESVKVYAVIGDIGASGAYYIAAAADEIYADKASIVGSIGVISASFGYVGVMEKLGVERRVFSAGDNKGMLDQFSPLSQPHVEHWQSLLGVTHQQFISQVKAGRGDRLKDDPAIFSGLMWTGEQALEQGLVDGLGSPSYVAREVIGEDNMLDYTLPVSPLGRMLKEFGVEVLSGLQRMLVSDEVRLRY